MKKIQLILLLTITIAQNNCLGQNNNLLFTKAWDEFSQKNYISSLTTLSELLEKDSTFAPAYLLKAKIYHQLERSLSIKKNEIEFLYKYSLLTPVSNDTLSIIGTTYFHLKDYSKAESCFLKAVRKDKSQSKYYSSIGAIKYFKKEYLQAISYCDTALQLNEKDHVTFFNRGQSYLKTDSFDLALKDFENAIKNDTLKKNLGNNLIGIGGVYTMNGDFEKANDYLKKGLKIYLNCHPEGNYYNALLKIKSYSSKDDICRELKYAIRCKSEEAVELYKYHCPDFDAKNSDSLASQSQKDSKSNTLVFPKIKEESKETIGAKTSVLIALLNNQHIAGENKNILFSKKLLSKFIEYLDPRSLVFIEKDIQLITSYHKQLLGNDTLLTGDSLVNYIQSSTDSLVNKVKGVYYQRLIMVDSLIQDIVSHPVNINKGGDLVRSNSYIKYHPKNLIELRERLEKQIRFDLINTAINEVNDSVLLKNVSNDILLLNQAKILELVGQKLKMDNRKKIEPIDGIDITLHSIFLNAITYFYDPHSSYFSDNEYKEFTESLSSESYGFGFHVNENRKGEMEIFSIDFGGPTWRDKNIEIGDIIIKFQEEDREEIELTYLNNNKLTEILSKKENHTLTFVFRKKSGQIISKKLIKENIESITNSSSCAVLKGKKNIGYIYLPSFYGTDDINHGMESSVAIMKDLAKLELESVDGIILDLRNNGGGIMNQSLQIAGWFLDLKNIIVSNNTLFIDTTKKTSTFQYKGPLVVLVNGQSASAAEYLSGLLKVMDRAVIVGSHTFGKFTSQIILPLDKKQYYNRFANGKSMGFLKVTTNRIYLPNNISFQAQGIAPHIDLPILYPYNIYKESEFDNTIKADTVFPLISIDAYPKLPIEQLKQMSKSRINDNQRFRQLIELNSKYQSWLKENETIKLQVEPLKQQRIRADEFNSELLRLKGFQTQSYNIQSTKIDIENFNNDVDKKRIHDEILNILNKDLQIEESYFIICDLIEILKDKQLPK